VLRVNSHQPKKQLVEAVIQGSFKSSQPPQRTLASFVLLPSRSLASPLLATTVILESISRKILGLQCSASIVQKDTSSNLPASSVLLALMDCTKSITSCTRSPNAAQRAQQRSPKISPSASLLKSLQFYRVKLLQMV
jgi:hypothetical protein